MLVGYMRVSTDNDPQVMDLQRDALLASGVDGQHLYEDRASGSRGDRSGLAAAPQELGRLERTLFTLDWLEDLELRRQTSQELNKGESRNSLARAVFIHRLGEIRDRTFENQKYRASGLNLIVTAIILWNTRYLARAIEFMRKKPRTCQTISSPTCLRWDGSTSI